MELLTLPNGVILCGILSAISLICSVYVKISVIDDNKRNFDALSPEFKRITAEFTAIKVDFSRLEFDNYTKLAKKVNTVEGEMVGIDVRVKELQSALNAFYAKWAKKLGGLDKKEEPAAAPQATNLPPEYMYPPEQQPTNGQSGFGSKPFH